MAETLLAELTTRLDPAEADALMSRAEARAAAAMTPIDRPSRILAGLAYGWMALLVFQNIVVVTTAAKSLDSTSLDDRRVFIPYLAFALAKIGLLCAGVYAFKAWRSLLTTAFFFLAILFAFPLGLFVQDWLLGAPNHDLRYLVTVSAICSYAAALCATVVYMRTREAARQPIAVEAFD
jgi:hypothetical protein